MIHKLIPSEVISFVFLFLLHSCSALSTFYNRGMSFVVFFSCFGLMLSSIWEEPTFMQLKKKSDILMSISFVVILLLESLNRAKFNPRSCQSWLLFIIHNSLLSSFETHCHKYWTGPHMNFSTVIINVLSSFLIFDIFSFLFPLFHISVFPVFNNLFSFFCNCISPFII